MTANLKKDLNLSLALVVICKFSENVTNTLGLYFLFF